MKLVPYIMFSGNAKEALDFYKEVLNGEINNLGTFGEAKMEVPDDYKDKVLHAVFSFGDNQIMVSDSMPGSPSDSGSNIHLSVDFPEDGEMQKTFSALSEGGAVSMPLQDTFWGATFGMLTDKFGVKWMFNHDKKK